MVVLSYNGQVEVPNDESTQLGGGHTPSPADGEPGDVSESDG
jgi:hypothetical protein